MSNFELTINNRDAIYATTQNYDPIGWTLILGCHETGIHRGHGYRVTYFVRNGEIVQADNLSVDWTTFKNIRWGGADKSE